MTESLQPSVLDAIKLAYDAADQVRLEPTDVVEYHSNGQVLLVGPAIAIARFGDLPENLTVQSLIAEEGIKLEGALGDFTLSTSSNDKQGLPAIKADLLVDLSDQPLLTMPITPPGYFYIDPSTTDLESVKAEITELVGTFEKPKYFTYDPNKCAHGRSGKAGCTRCLDACPTEAITSLIDKIKVDPYRCQGGGICATVCPSGAIQYSYPKPLNLLQRVRQMILTFREAKGSAPQLVLTSEAAMTLAEQQFPKSLILAVEETASVGLETWFSALAWGASSIVILEPHEIAPNTLDALKLHVETAQSILSGMNFPQNVISLQFSPTPDVANAMPEITTTHHAALLDKRQSFYMAVDHLAEQAQQLEESVALPQGAIFGTVQVDKDACTLCMSCVSACPGNALQDGREIPQLGFVEAKCLQCNICVNTCPENAITIQPRFVLNKAQRTQTIILNEEPPFCCITCGKPFATQSGITTILDKLAGHPMFTTERSKQRLKMCDDCRVKDMMEDPEANL